MCLISLLLIISYVAIFKMWCQIIRLVNFHFSIHPLKAFPHLQNAAMTAKFNKNFNNVSIIVLFYFILQVKEGLCVTMAMITEDIMFELF